MTVSDKLVSIGRKLTRIFDVGFEKGYGKGHTDGFEEGVSQSDYTQGFEDGKKAEYDAFWDVYLRENMSNWQYIFYSPRWRDDNFYPNKDIRPIGVFSYGLASNFITNLKQRLIDCGVILDTSGVTSGNYEFCFCTNLTHLPTLSFTGLTEDISFTFADDRKLVEIEKIILKDDGSATFNYWFRNCNELTTIAFEGVIGQDINFQWSTKLNEASIRSIIGHLSDTASGKTLTLSKVAADNAFPQWIPGDVNVGTELNSAWATLVASKPNWTITLV